MIKTVAIKSHKSDMWQPFQFIFENTIVPNIPNTIMKIMNPKVLSLNLTISVELFDASNIMQIHQTATNI